MPCTHEYAPPSSSVTARERERERVKEGERVCVYEGSKVGGGRVRE